MILAAFDGVYDKWMEETVDVVKTLNDTIYNLRVRLIALIVENMWVSSSFPLHAKMFQTQTWND